MKSKAKELRRRLAGLALAGTTTGDQFGEMFFGLPETVQQSIIRRELPPGPWRYTDDSNMAVSVCRNLIAFKGIREDELARSFAAMFFSDPMRGYGRGAAEILQAIFRGVSWKQASAAAFGGQGSKGNGGAMRAAPVGAYFWDDPARAAEHARRSARVTHHHPDGQEGAAAVAIAASWAARRHEDPSATGGLFDEVLSGLRSGALADGIRRAASLTADISPAEAARVLGSGQNILAEDTVPFVLWCVSRHPDDFEEALWTTVEGLGDRDTTCAMVGGIVSLSGDCEDIPASWRARCESLPGNDASCAFGTSDGGEA
jgi:ADP-ribosylglycohydrolase